MASFSFGSRTATLLAIAFCLTPSQAFAADWYVDATNGNDLNNGASPTQAWRTISHAASQFAGGGAEVIHVAEGLYDVAHGEQFPIYMQPGVRIAGASHAAPPIVSGLDQATSALFVFQSTAFGQDFDASSGLERLLLRRAEIGVSLNDGAGLMSPKLNDLTVERTGAAIYVVSILAATNCTPTLERVHASGGDYGLRMQGVQAPGPNVRAIDCSFERFDIDGVSLAFFGALTLDRCRVQDNGWRGIKVWAQGSSLELTCRDSLIAGNELEGVHATVRESAQAQVRFERTTIADNGVTGVSEFNDLPSATNFLALELDHCVLSNGQQDLSISTPATVRRSLIHDGQYNGVNGSFAADPLFRDSANGDWRLRWTSPCIDAAIVTPAAGALDLAGRSRDVDGDLNTVDVSDLGAFEFEPLGLASSGALGTTLQLDVWGAQGAASTIYWSRAGLGAGAATPFGSFELAPALARTFRMTTAGAVTPTTVLRNIPNASLLVGHTFAFQALTDSFAAPLSKAFTNGVELLITP